MSLGSWYVFRVYPDRLNLRPGFPTWMHLKGKAVESGERALPQRLERYHRGHLMSINFVPGYARNTV